MCDSGGVPVRVPFIILSAENQLLRAIDCGQLCLSLNKKPVTAFKRDMEPPEAAVSWSPHPNSIISHANHSKVQVTDYRAT